MIDRFGNYLPGDAVECEIRRDANGPMAVGVVELDNQDSREDGKTDPIAATQRDQARTGDAMCCARCGKQYLENIGYCRYCGADRPGSNQEPGATKWTYDTMLQGIEKGEFTAVTVDPDVGLASDELCYLAAAGGACGFFHGSPTVGYLGDLYVTDKRILFKPRQQCWPRGPEGPRALGSDSNAVSIPMDHLFACFQSKPSVTVLWLGIGANGSRVFSFAQLALPNEEYEKIVVALIPKLAPPPQSVMPNEEYAKKAAALISELKPPLDAHRSREGDAKPHQQETARQGAPAVAGPTGHVGNERGAGSGGTQSGAGGSRVRGKVKWFDNAKGHGFISLGSGPDVFVHYSRISMDGFKTLQEGDSVEFEIVQGAHGPMASRATKVGGHAQDIPARDTPRVRGVVKWFETKKGYGFISYEGAPDVFLHYSVIKMDGYKSLLEGDLVEFEIVQGTHGPMASRVVKLSEAQSGAKAQEAAPVAQVVASHVKLAFPKTVFEVYIDHVRVIHLGWEGTPRTDEVRSFLRGLILKGQIPYVEFDFHHAAPETPRGSESTRSAPNAASSVASFLKSSFPGTAFEVYSQNPSVVHIAWKGRPDTDEVRSTLQRLRAQHMIPDVSLNFHHVDARKSSSSSASGAKDRTRSRPKVKSVSPKGPYEILGVKPGTPLAEITSAYRRLATLYHPDKVASLAPEYKEIAERRMKEINAAYEELQRQFR